MLLLQTVSYAIESDWVVLFVPRGEYLSYQTSPILLWSDAVCCREDKLTSSKRMGYLKLAIRLSRTIAVLPPNANLSITIAKAPTSQWRQAITARAGGRSQVGQGRG